MRGGWFCGVVSGLLAFHAGTGAASAQLTVPLCSSLNLPRPLWGAGGSAITATFGLIAVELAKLPEPITILYSDPSACTGFAGFLGGNAKGNFWYWTAAGEQKSCAVDQSTGQAVDFAHLGTPASECGAPVPPGVGRFLAPVQTINVITGINATDDSISAEALYFIYGFGAAGQVAPWTNEAHIVLRPPTSAVHRLLAAAIGVPADRFKGSRSLSGADPLAQVVEFSTNGQGGALGYVSGSAADKARTSVKTLAYQAKDQKCAYWPDSSPTTNDKLPVRTGQYALAAPGYFYARVGETSGVPSVPSVPEDERVARLLQWFDGTVTPPGGVDVIGKSIDAGDVPLCAMRALRETITGAVSSWVPPVPCGHFFEKRATGETEGRACENDAGCAAVPGNPRCRFGYCEAY